MSWISDIGSALGGAVTAGEGIINTAASAGHELLGSSGTLQVGNVSIGTGITQGDVTTTNTNASASGTAVLNSNILSGFMAELTSNPIILIGLVVLIIILVMKK